MEDQDRIGVRFKNPELINSVSSSLVQLYPEPGSYEVTLKTEVATPEEYADFLRQNPRQKPYRPLVQFQYIGSNHHRNGRGLK